MVRAVLMTQEDAVCALNYPAGTARRGHSIYAHECPFWV